MLARTTTLIATFLLRQLLFSQDSSQITLQQIPNQYLDKVSSKAVDLEAKLDKKAEKVLLQFEKQEARIKKKLAKFDSLSANNIFGDATNKYNELKKHLENVSSLKQYIPFLDTAATSLKFLEQNPQLLTQVKDAGKKLKDAVEKVKGLENSLGKAEEIKKFLKERKQYLKEQLEKFTSSLGGNFAKQFKKLNKEAYYFSQQITEYKNILKDPKKVERKALELLTKTKLFQDFMRKNSMLAFLFRVPLDDPYDPTYLANLSGLQTRVQVNALIDRQISSGGPNAMLQFQQNMADARSQINLLKDKIIKPGGSRSDAEMPDGSKPNQEKTRSFLKRLELGGNIQTTRHNQVFPVASDIGLSVGYRLNQNFILGIGSSFKIGWGQSFRNIKITSQGLSFRSYLDLKIKGGIYASAAYEQNYFAEIRNIQQLHDYNSWKSSALLGVSKKYKYGRKGKSGEIKLLYDFFYSRVVPKTQPLLFRIGYNF